MRLQILLEALHKLEIDPKRLDHLYVENKIPDNLSLFLIEYIYLFGISENIENICINIKKEFKDNSCSFVIYRVKRKDKKIFNIIEHSSDSIDMTADVEYVLNKKDVSASVWDNIKLLNDVFSKNLKVDNLVESKEPVEEVELSSPLDIIEKLNDFKSKVPIIPHKQENEMECGATCLYMIASQFEKLNRYEYRNIILPTKHGSSFADLLVAAKSRDYIVSVKKTDFKYSPFGQNAFVALTDYHFVVVTGVKDDQVTYLDPSLGKRTIQVEEAQQQWSGYCLAIAPNFNKYINQCKKNDVKFKFEDYKFFLFLLFIISLISVADYMENNVVRNIFNDINFSNKNEVILYATLLFGSNIISVFVELLERKRINFKFLKEQLVFVRSVFSTSPAYLKIINPKDFLLRIEDISKYINAIYDIPVLFFSKLFTLSLSCFLLFQVHTSFFLIVAFSSLLQGSIVYISRGYHVKYSQLLTDKKNVFDYLMTEYMSGIKTLISLERGKSATSRLLSFFDVYKQAEFKKIDFHSKIGIATQLLDKTSWFLTIFTAVFLYSQDIIGIGDIMIAVTLTIAVIEPIVNLVIQSTELLELKVVKQRIEGLDSYPKCQNKRTNYKFRYQKNDISLSLKNLYYKFPGPLSTFALENISYTFESGSIYGIVGHSGSGKSTLAQVLSAQSDSILNTNTIELSNIQRSALSNSTLYLSASDPVFPGSLMENVKLGHDGGNISLTLKYLNRFWHDRIISIEDLQQINLKNKELELSSGQLQRLLFARAVYHQPSLLIIDECFSSINLATEEEICLKLKEYFPNSIVIFITHRASLMKYCDKVLYMKHGQILTTGECREVIVNNIEFRHMYANG